ncbi:unnamed protein product [Pylaiella littoralis]
MATRGVQKSAEKKSRKLLCWNENKPFAFTRWCFRFRRRTPEGVANSRVVSVGVLLTLRVASLLFLLLGGLWVILRRWERPLCLPDWSYVASTLYFSMAVAACLRHACKARSTPAAEEAITAAAEGSPSQSLIVASSIAFYFFEVSVVYQTIAVVVTWVEYALGRGPVRRALLSSMGLGLLLLDFLLNRCTVEAKHTCLLLGFLLVWMVEQVVWVSTDDGHEACYDAFDAKALSSAVTAVVVALAVVGLTFAYAALCAQRDKLMLRLGFRPDADPSGQGDVEEDAGEDAAVARSVSLRAMNTFRVLPASERPSVVNPIFAGAGSRMKRQMVNGGSSSSSGGGGGGGGNGSVRGLGERRTSLASIETDMSSGELDVDTQGTGATASSSGRHPSRSPPAAAPPRDSSRAERRGDWGSDGIPNRSSWAGYGGGGAAAWVRSVRDEPPPSRGGGGKGGHRRPTHKY